MAEAEIWSIPAHAGKTSRRGPRPTQRQVDPRSRGEDDFGATGPATREGRSPLTRGRPVRRSCGVSKKGSIPAHAGKTGSTAGLSARPWVDPRSRGEDPRQSPHALRRPGRSPLTRGRLSGRALVDIPQGSIPAHAGKTPLHAVRDRSIRVDPRSRGEDFTAPPPLSGRHGRSPLTRGRRPVTRCAASPAGSIPAHAGKTVHPRGQPVAPRVDPRSRGEDCQRSQPCRNMTGRSPLTRGRQWGRFCGFCYTGSIPAHAGKTRARAAGEFRRWVDPRSRGEDPRRSRLSPSTMGRSPLTRGRRQNRGRALQRLRSIPAHAGKT